ncbi:hypothetical protein O6H91_16G045700 [Diphasiastrum complanatum]|uniref:Uncharacterized protein n=1 Tax=Diphasiastrum complanatum TaxID=34168 RepID=A0ACC2BBV5_DIPCM|nr:hypothetical protein O6H91_16G045700 [Diphasiastrum complanatum]
MKITSNIFAVKDEKGESELVDMVLEKIWMKETRKRTVLQTTEGRGNNVMRSRAGAMVDFQEEAMVAAAVATVINLTLWITLFDSVLSPGCCSKITLSDLKQGFRPI